MTHICVSKLTIIGSHNGLSPGRRQAIIWTNDGNDGILLIGPLGTNFSEILIEIYRFSFKKMQLKMSSGKWRPFCLGLNVFIRKASPCRHLVHIFSTGLQCYNRGVIWDWLRVELTVNALCWGGTYNHHHHHHHQGHHCHHYQPTHLTSRMQGFELPIALFTRHNHKSSTNLCIFENRLPVPEHRN